MDATTTILHTVLHAVWHSFLDNLHVLPFLFLTYLFMEFLEHRAGERTNRLIEKAGKAGPLAGGLVGALPQCGFASVAAELYAGRVITLGTLFAVFLSASDEMLPVLIAEGAPLPLILKLVGLKAVLGILYGFLIDLMFRLFHKKTEDAHHHSHEVGALCQKEHCHCGEKGIFLSALRHTLPVFLFLVILSVLLTLVITLVGEDTLSAFLTGMPALSAFLASLVGCIPNCASSVLLTELYLSGVLSGGAMTAGLLTGAGVGTLVLFRANRRLSENLLILGGLILIGSLTGFFLDVTGFLSFFLA